MYRSINDCFELLKEEDSNTAITKYLIRNLAKKNLVKTLQVGSKFLIDYISLKDYLDKGGVA